MEDNAERPSRTPYRDRRSGGSGRRGWPYLKLVFQDFDSQNRFGGCPTGGANSFEGRFDRSSTVAPHF